MVFLILGGSIRYHLNFERFHRYSEKPVFFFFFTVKFQINEWCFLNFQTSKPHKNINSINIIIDFQQKIKINSFLTFWNVTLKKLSENASFTLLYSGSSSNFSEELKTNFLTDKNSNSAA